MNLRIAYLHNKTGKRYRLLAFAMNCTNGDQDGQPMVIYCDALDESRIYARNVAEFEQKFTREQS